MKKYIESLLLLCVAAFTLTACSEDEGTNPGGDGNPNVVVYQYTPGQPYNADNDGRRSIISPSQKLTITPTSLRWVRLVTMTTWWRTAPR